MPYELKKLTPNLIVANVERSLAFYRDALGFSVGMIVPDAPPFVFASVVSGGIEIFFNERDVATKEYPAFGNQPIGGTLTLFIEVVGIKRIHDALKDRVKIVMPFEKKWYGMTEFAFSDPDGYVVTLAERSK